MSAIRLYVAKFEPHDEHPIACKIRKVGGVRHIFRYLRVCSLSASRAVPGALGDQPARGHAHGAELRLEPRLERLPVNPRLDVERKVAPKARAEIEMAGQVPPWAVRVSRPPDRRLGHAGNLCDRSQVEQRRLHHLNSRNRHGPDAPHPIPEIGEVIPAAAGEQPAGQGGKEYARDAGRHGKMLRHLLERGRCCSSENARVVFHASIIRSMRENFQSLIRRDAVSIVDNQDLREADQAPRKCQYGCPHVNDPIRRREIA